MSIELCNICENWMDADDCDYCICCGEPVCEKHVRVRDDPNQIDESNYCLSCYLQNGHGEVWDIQYVTTQGDILKMSMDTPVNTLSFLIPKYARQQGGALFLKVANFHKVKDVSAYLTKEV